MLDNDEIVEIMEKTVKMMNEIMGHLKGPDDELAPEEVVKRYLTIRAELKWLCEKFDHSMLTESDIQWIWKDKPNMSWTNIYDRLSFINRKLFTIL